MQCMPRTTSVAIQSQMMVQAFTYMDPLAMVVGLLVFALVGFVGDREPFTAEHEVVDSISERSSNCVSCYHLFSLCSFTRYFSCNDHCLVHGLLSNGRVAFPRVEKTRSQSFAVIALRLAFAVPFEMQSSLSTVHFHYCGLWCVRVKSKSNRRVRLPLRVQVLRCFDLGSNPVLHARENLKTDEPFE